jgi:hypothetical protein
MNRHLMEFLAKKYPEPDDAVLDCMAETGSCDVVTALFGSARERGFKSHSRTNMLKSIAGQ